MSGVFDSIQKKMDDSGSEGLSPIQIASLPPIERKIVRMLLRELEMVHEGIWEALQKQPEGERPTREEMEAAMENLANEGWVIRMGEGDNRKYEPNMRRKAPSTLAKAIWAQLGTRIADSKTAQESEDDRD
jgi:hypothetical protein